MNPRISPRLSKQFSLHAKFYGASGVIRKCLHEFVGKSTAPHAIQVESFAPGGGYI
jgi:hypothetical protein